MALWNPVIGKLEFQEASFKSQQPNRVRLAPGFVWGRPGWFPSKSQGAPITGGAGPLPVRRPREFR